MNELNEKNKMNQKNNLKKKNKLSEMNLLNALNLKGLRMGPLGTFAGLRVLDKER